MSDLQPPPARPPRKPLGIVRGIFAAVGVIVMVLTGGCAITILFSGPLNGEDLTMVGTIAGIPFLIGLAIFLVAIHGSR